MLMTKSRHLASVAELHELLVERENQLAQLHTRVRNAERAAHKLAENTRYTLESAAYAFEDINKEASHSLHAIAHALPYVFAGRRHWQDHQDPALTAKARAGANAVTRAHGFELPTDPLAAVVSLLALASMLFVPSHCEQVEGLRHAYPVVPDKPDEPAIEPTPSAIEKELGTEQIELREAVSHARSIGATGVNGVSTDLLEHYFSLLDQSTNQATS